MSQSSIPEPFSGIKPYNPLPPPSKKPSRASTSAPAKRAEVPADLRHVRRLIGTGVMEGLAEMNKRAFSSPHLLLPLTLLALLLDYLLNWWPTPGIWWSPISLVAGFGLVWLPVLGGVELINRTYFEKKMRETLGSSDLIDIPSFYNIPTPATSSPSVSSVSGPSSTSTFLMLHHRSLPIGLIAIDSNPSTVGKKSEVLLPEVKEKGWLEILFGMGKGKARIQALEEKLDDTISGVTSALEVEGKRLDDGSGSGSITNRKKGSNGISIGSTATPKQVKAGTAQIRHWIVDSPYRKTRCGSLLFETALDQVFSPTNGNNMNKTPKIDRVVLQIPFYTKPDTLAALRKLGLRPLFGQEAEELGLEGTEDREWKGLLGGVGGRKWRGEWWGFERGEWEGRKGEKRG